MNVAIVGGAGGVGSSVAFNLLLRGGHHVLVVDSREDMVESHVLDLEQVLESGGTGTIRGGTLEEVLEADVVVVAASAPLTVNTSRLDYLTTNAGVLADLVVLMTGAPGWPGILIVVTNPVDPLCTWMQRHTGVDRTRVLGYTLNDSLRLRTGIARALDLDAGSVEAWVVGEHGDGCVPLFDRVRVNGEPVTLTARQRALAEEFLRTWYVRHVALDSGRSSTWTSGLGVTRMVSSIAEDAGDVVPSSVVLDGEYGLEGVAVSVPIALGRQGARILEWSLSPEQHADLRRAAGIVREALEQLDTVVGPIEPGRPSPGTS